MADWMMRPCGGTWVYCEGDCDTCTRGQFTTSNTTKTDERGNGK